MRIWGCVFLMAVLFFSCHSEGNYREEDLYLDYQVTGEEGAEQVSVLLQFRERNSYGPTVELKKGSTVLLDGKPLSLNKETRNGPIYVASFPPQEFKGEHTIRFTSSKGKTWSQRLLFTVISLSDQAVFETMVDSTGFELEVNASHPIRDIRVMMTDTSYAGKEVDKLIPLAGNTLRIRGSDLRGLKPGPIQLELVASYDKKMEEKQGPRGALHVTYTLRREFIFQGFLDTSARR